MKNFLENFLSKYYTQDEKIILACSTGPDSMYLLYHLLQTSYKKNIIACYFNHKLRPEADREEEFLLSLGEQMGFQVEIATGDIQHLKETLYPNRSIEEIAREKRYMFFSTICEIYHTKKVMTAHHLDDKIETFFFHLLRGSKLTGLINMKEFHGNILRPLLGISKEDILKYLHENNLEYMIDESNFENIYSRNFLRNEIIPNFEHINSKWKKNISQTLDYFEDLKDFIDEEVINFLSQNALPKVFDGSDKKGFLLESFLAQSIFLKKEILRYLYYISNGNSTIGLSVENIDEMLRFIDGKNNKTKKEIRNLKLYKDGKYIFY